MMVPRSYAHASPSPSASMKYSEKDSPSVTTIERAERKAGVRKEPNIRKEAGQAPRLPSVLAPPPTTPSKPVVIPTRTRHDGTRRSKGQGPVDRKLSPETATTHDQSSVTPSMSALLAMTSIPTSKRISPSSGQRRGVESKNDAKRRITHAGNPRRALSSSSPQTWDFLLSPPDDEGVESRSFESDTTIGPSSSVRSVSTESMPSLDEDDDSICSASDPATPGMMATSRNGRKSLSTSVGKDCVLDHPLLPPSSRSVESIAEQTEIDIGPSGRRPSAPRMTTSFKSNLTASFRAVRSAARSFSNFTTSSSNIHREDHLSQSLLSLTLPYTVERRPLPSNDPPDPALRRYLNPIALSPTDLHFHDGKLDEIAVKASIQLQTYQRGNRPSQHASSPPIFASKEQSLRKDALDTEDPLTSSLLPKQREPRENSDFLRVIVLEMNMRKVGKLSSTNPGRARLWLPARQVGNTAPPVGGEVNEEAHGSRSAREQSEGGLSSAKDVPARWVGVKV